MMEILRQYLQLCRFNGTLIEQQQSVAFLRLVLLVYLAAGIFIQANITHAVEAFIQLSLQTIIVFLFVAVLLFSIKSLNLYVQTVTAFLVCADLLYVFGLPFLFWVTISDSLLAYAALAMVFVWGIAIIAYILKQLAFFSKTASFFLSLLYYILVYFGTFLLALAIL